MSPTRILVVDDERGVRTLSADILRRAGFVEIEAVETVVDLICRRPVQEVAALASNLGPAARIVQEHEGTAEHVTRISDEVAKSFARFADRDGVRIPARLNFFRANRSTV